MLELIKSMNKLSSWAREASKISCDLQWLCLKSLRTWPSPELSKRVENFELYSGKPLCSCWRVNGRRQVALLLVTCGLYCQNQTEMHSSVASFMEHVSAESAQLVLQQGLPAVSAI